MGEIVALVDRDGNVTGSAERRVVRRDNLMHAATAVLVRNSKREIYVHRRALDKDWAPGLHDCAAGGVVRRGESPLQAALRELAEELGVRGVDLTPLGRSVYEDHSLRCVESCFQTTWDGPVVHADGEVLAGRWLAMERLDELLAEPDWGFVPDTRTLLTRLATDGVADYPALTSLRA